MSKSSSQGRCERDDDKRHEDSRDMTLLSDRGVEAGQVDNRMQPRWGKDSDYSTRDALSFPVSLYLAGRE